MKKIVHTLLLSTLLTGSIAIAETTTCSAVSTVNTSIENLSTAVENQQQLVSKLSDDIGIMADRIGEMADRIGVMADRIVTTERLLADTLIILTGNADLGTSSSSSTAVILLKPLDGDTVSKTTAPAIQISTASTKYILYASTEPTFSDGTTISMYIESDAGLSTSWQHVVDFAGTSNTIYIAIKSVDANNKISSLSNGAKLTLQ